MWLIDNRMHLRNMSDCCLCIFAFMRLQAYWFISVIKHIIKATCSWSLGGKGGVGNVGLIVASCPWNCCTSLCSVLCKCISKIWKNTFYTLDKYILLFGLLLCNVRICRCSSTGVCYAHIWGLVRHKDVMLHHSQIVIFCNFPISCGCTI